MLIGVARPESSKGVVNPTNLHALRRLRACHSSFFHSMYFLAIETSCDETAAAVFTEEPKILSNIVASQTDLHARFGGVVPEVAARAHLQRLLPGIDDALSQAGVKLQEIG